MYFSKVRNVWSKQKPMTSSFFQCCFRNKNISYQFCQFFISENIFILFLKKQRKWFLIVYIGLSAMQIDSHANIYIYIYICIYSRHNKNKSSNPNSSNNILTPTFPSLSSMLPLTSINYWILIHNFDNKIENIP